jgi:hypothetical protein
MAENRDTDLKSGHRPRGAECIEYRAIIIDEEVSCGMALHVVIA